MSNPVPGPDGAPPPQDATDRSIDHRPPVPPRALPPAAAGGHGVPHPPPAVPGPPGGYGPPPPYGAPPPYGPPAPYGYGAPGQYLPPGYGAPAGWSHRTKVAAGLLQLLPGIFLGLGGIGRCYTGHIGLGVTHIVLSVLGWITIWAFIGFPLVIACWIWAVVDGIVLLSGQPRDADGLLLR
ncbi:TM2 domain-containing membrane protein YozV [Isoptericola jiangsuensis]|uniref:TM2 domain-containing membrane protein YozV n=2 Tax=Isoptericola jiangsuensis TaxID=548579 RepID=A0A2A9EZA0_9MICO|nr:TM2 domain-containing membrane protein YozV [Isoptericola jiangsuensis]